MHRVHYCIGLEKHQWHTSQSSTTFSRVFHSHRRIKRWEEKEREREREREGEKVRWPGDVRSVDSEETTKKNTTSKGRDGKTFVLAITNTVAVLLQRLSLPPALHNRHVVVDCPETAHRSVGRDRFNSLVHLHSPRLTPNGPLLLPQFSSRD